MLIRIFSVNNNISISTTIWNLVGNIRVELREFDHSDTNIPNVSEDARISLGDLIRAAITVGYPISGADLRWFPVWIWRFLKFPGVVYLLEAEQYWHLSDAVELLDPSEKRIVSYELGMIFTKLVAERYMGVTWLRHVDEMIKSGQITLRDGGSLQSRRGDLVGQDSLHRWHVIEAKGMRYECQNIDRCNREGKLEEAKGQAERISLINNQQPLTRSGSLVLLNTHFVKTIIEDPDEEGSVSIFLDEKKFVTGYYNVLIMLMKKLGYSTIKESGREYDVFRLAINKSEISIGMLSEIHRNPSNAVRIIKELNLEPIYGDENLSLGLDGVIVKWRNLSEKIVDCWIKEGLVDV